MQIERKGRQPIYVLMGIVIALMLTVGAFFSEGIAFFNPVYTSFMTDSEYFLSLGAVFLCVGLFLFLAHRYFKIKQNFIFMALALLLFAGNIVAIAIFPSVYQTMGVKYTNTEEIFDAFNLVYFLNSMDKVRYILTFGVSCLYLYLMFTYFPQVLKSSRALNIYFLAAIIVIFVSVIWSIYFEFDIYKSFFTLDSETPITQVIESFWGNRNTFGTMVLIGIVGTAYLQCRSRHFYYYILMGLFTLIQFFVLSKTALGLSLIFIVAFLIYRYIVTVRRHWLKNNIALVAISATIGAILWIILSGFIHEIPFFGKCYEHMYKELFDSEFSSFHSRVFIWKVVMRDVLASPLKMIFGLGDGNYLRLLGYELEYNQLKLGYTHNGPLAMFAYGGLIRLAVYAAMIVYLFVLIIINFTKKKHPHTIACLLGLIVFLGHSVVETTAFLGSDAKSTALMLVVYLPVLIDRYHDKHPERVAELRSGIESRVEQNVEARKNTSVGHLYVPTFLSALVASTIFACFFLIPSVVGIVELVLTVVTFAISIGVSIAFAYRKGLRKPVGVGVLRIVSSLLLICAYVLPLIFKQIAFQLYAGLVAALLIIILSNKPVKQDDSTKIELIKPILLGTGFVAVGLLAGFGLSKLPLEMTRYTVLTLIVIYVMVAIVFILAFTCGHFTTKKRLALVNGWARYEDATFLWHDKMEAKLADKIAKYKAKKPKRKKGISH